MPGEATEILFNRRDVCIAYNKKRRELSCGDTEAPLEMEVGKARGAHADGIVQRLTFLETTAACMFLEFLTLRTTTPLQSKSAAEMRRSTR